jgi:hypothetical protein
MLGNKPMKTLLTLFTLTCTSAFAQENVSFEQQANIKAETQLSETFIKIKAAKDAVIAAIDAIGDPKKRELYKILFERNEKAWDELVDSTALLQQPVEDASTKPDIRYTRILGSEYSKFRIKQYQDFARWMKQRQ